MFIPQHGRASMAADAAAARRARARAEEEKRAQSAADREARGDADEVRAAHDEVVADYQALGRTGSTAWELACGTWRERTGGRRLTPLQYHQLIALGPPADAEKEKEDMAEQARVTMAELREEALRQAASTHCLNLSEPADRAKATRIVLHNRPHLKPLFSGEHAPPATDELALAFKETAMKHNLNLATFDDRQRVATIVAKQHPSVLPQYGYGRAAGRDALQQARREVAEEYRLAEERVPDSMIYSKRPELRPTMETARTFNEAIEAAKLDNGWSLTDPRPEQAREAVAIAMRERPDLKPIYGREVFHTPDAEPRRFADRAPDPLLTKLAEVRRAHGLPDTPKGHLEAASLMSRDPDVREALRARYSCGRTS